MLQLGQGVLQTGRRVRIVLKDPAHLILRRGPRSIRQLRRVEAGHRADLGALGDGGGCDRRRRWRAAPCGSGERVVAHASEERRQEAGELVRRQAAVGIRVVLAGDRLGEILDDGGDLNRARGHAAPRKAVRGRGSKPGARAAIAGSRAFSGAGPAPGVGRSAGRVGPLAEAPPGTADSGSGWLCGNIRHSSVRSRPRPSSSWPARTACGAPSCQFRFPSACPFRMPRRPSCGWRE